MWVVGPIVYDFQAHKPSQEYIELSRSEPEVQFQKLKADHPYGFDIVVEATGSPKILEDAINYVRRYAGRNLSLCNRILICV